VPGTTPCSTPTPGRATPAVSTGSGGPAPTRSTTSSSPASPSRGRWPPLLHLAVYFPEFRVAGKWRADALGFLEGQLDDSTYPDGGYWEATDGGHALDADQGAGFDGCGGDHAPGRQPGLRPDRSPHQSLRALHERSILALHSGLWQDAEYCVVRQDGHGRNHLRHPPAALHGSGGPVGRRGTPPRQRRHAVRGDRAEPGRARRGRVRQVLEQAGVPAVRAVRLRREDVLHRDRRRGSDGRDGARHVERDGATRV